MQNERCNKMDLNGLAVFFENMRKRLNFALEKQILERVIY